MEKNPELYRLCLNYSDDAFHHRGFMIIAYNSNKPAGRIRFSLMHELGHHILEHKSDTRENEREANIFASHILAPRIAIYYADCKNSADVSRIFGLTNEASEYAFKDFRRWRRQLYTCHKRISAIDMDIYKHFYSILKKQFIWSVKKCESCNKLFYNSSKNICEKCRKKLKSSGIPYIPVAFSSSIDIPYYDDMRKDFRKAEDYYLYGDDL